MYEDIGGYDMTYCELKEMGRNAWSEKFSYCFIDMSKKVKVKIVYSMRAMPHI